MSLNFSFGTPITSSLSYIVGYLRQHIHDGNTLTSGAGKYSGIKSKKITHESLIGIHENAHHIKLHLLTFTYDAEDRDIKHLYTAITNLSLTWGSNITTLNILSNESITITNVGSLYLYAQETHLIGRLTVNSATLPRQTFNLPLGITSSIDCPLSPLDTIAVSRSNLTGTLAPELLHCSLKTTILNKNGQKVLGYLPMASFPGNLGSSSVTREDFSLDYYVTKIERAKINNLDDYEHPLTTNYPCLTQTSLTDYQKNYLELINHRRSIINYQSSQESISNHIEKTNYISLMRCQTERFRHGSGRWVENVKACYIRKHFDPIQPGVHQSFYVNIQIAWKYGLKSSPGIFGRLLDYDLGNTGWMTSYPYYWNNTHLRISFYGCNIGNHEYDLFKRSPYLEREWNRILSNTDELQYIILWLKKDKQGPVSGFFFEGDTFVEFAKGNIKCF